MKSAYLKMHAAILLWGLTGIFGKLISLDELPLVWWRMTITVIILGAALKWFDQLDTTILKKAKGALFSGAVLASHWIFFFASIKYSNVSIALCTLASTAMFSTLIQSAIARQRPMAKELIASAFTILGVGVVFQFQELHVVGIMLGLVSAFLGATVTIQTKILLDEYSPYNLLFLQLVGGVGVITLIAPLYFMANPTTAVLPVGADWLYLLVLGGLCTAYAMKLAYDSLAHVSAFVLNLSTNLEPLYSILLAFVLFKEYEQLNNGFYIGSVLILFSVVLGTVNFSDLWSNSKKTVKE
jgi:drug/metabolite transporter (DMT)-like permease